LKSLGAFWSSLAAGIAIGNITYPNVEKNYSRGGTVKQLRKYDRSKILACWMAIEDSNGLTTQSIGEVAADAVIYGKAICGISKEEAKEILLSYFGGFFGVESEPWEERAQAMLPLVEAAINLCGGPFDVTLGSKVLVEQKRFQALQDALGGYQILAEQEAREQASGLNHADQPIPRTPKRGGKAKPPKA
jgi:hypothetical protein